MERARTRRPSARPYGRVPPEFGLGFSAAVAVAVGIVLAFGDSAAAVGIAAGAVVGLCVGVLVSR